MLATNKILWRKFTALDYFQKSTGIFNKNGMISAEELERMKARAQTGEKNLWHGFISVDEENSHKIDSPEKCIHLIKRTFDSFFRDMGFDPKNIDLICALHLDRPKHLHIHFEFWEKEPKQKYRKKQTEYRHKGKIPQEVIDKMHERLNLILADEHIYHSRDEALRQLKELSVTLIKAQDPETAVTYNFIRKLLDGDKVRHFRSGSRYILNFDDLLNELNMN